MTLDDWYTLAAADADRRDLPDLTTVLKGLRSAAATLRAANWNDDARGTEATSTTDATESSLPSPRASS